MSSKRSAARSPITSSVVVATNCPLKHSSRCSTKHAALAGVLVPLQAQALIQDLPAARHLGLQRPQALLKTPKGAAPELPGLLLHSLTLTTGAGAIAMHQVVGTFAGNLNHSWQRRDHEANHLDQLKKSGAGQKENSVAHSSSTHQAEGMTGLIDQLHGIAATGGLLHHCGSHQADHHETIRMVIASMTKLTGSKLQTAETGMTGIDSKTGPGMEGVMRRKSIAETSMPMRTMTDALKDAERTSITVGKRLSSRAKHKIRTAETQMVMPARGTGVMKE